MRRIKSAPANIAEMINRKIETKSSLNKIVIPILNKKYNIIIEEVNNENCEKNIIKNDKSNIIKNDKSNSNTNNIIEYNRFKSQKNKDYVVAKSAFSIIRKMVTNKMLGFLAIASFLGILALSFL